MNSKNEFGIESYKKLISLIKLKGINVINFQQVSKGRKGVIMRHDIDFCPLRASTIAEIESKNDISSTYFILINSELYNFREKDNLNSLRNILALGHKIGLHFDCSIYPKNYRILNKECKKEVKILNDTFGVDINIVSFHRPSKELIGNPNKFGGIEHTYLPKFIREIDYCSDSQGVWRFKNPFDLIENKDFSTLQLLTHPIWWTTPKKLSPHEKVAYHLKKKTIKLHIEAGKNCIPYRKYIKNKSKINNFK